MSTGNTKPETTTVRLPVCRRCRHFHVTWDPCAPNGCHALGFKTRRSPSRVVYETSGMPCRLFVARSDANVKAGS